MFTKKGFTLVETIVALAIFLLAISALSYFILGGFNFWRQGFSKLQSQKDVKRIVERMIFEIRKAQYSDTGAYPLEKGKSQEIIFYADIDQEPDRERIRYFLENTDFKKGIIKSEGNPLEYPLEKEKISIVLKNVQNKEKAIFEYFDKDYSGKENALPQPVDVTDVKLIKIFFTIDDNLERAPKEFILEGKAMLRNLKENL